MNKQEVIDEIEEAIPDFSLNDYQRGKETGLTYALELVRELNEPEKPIVPQFVVEYIEYCKHEKFYALHGAYADMDDRLKCWRFKGNNSELFAKAWLYGYEVEKEKLYTARLKSTGEYLYYDKDYGNAYHMSVCDNIPQKVKGYHFTEEELIEYFAWENEAYEIEEVEE